jgi:hypothetical protein
VKTFLALHQIASQRGDGLKSELARLLESPASAARTRSNVLSQTASYLTIDEHNIVVEPSSDDPRMKPSDANGTAGSVPCSPARLPYPVGCAGASPGR